ncbi:MAG: glycerol-3-phosphate dehydrogenase/oxidase [bacterium]
MTSSATTLGERLEALRSRTFDLLVIGGGITGCGIARDAALRKMSVALVEKDDFASGTSSRSSRLIHGGVRYLEHGYLHLVFESSAERRRLLRLAGHLVRPLPFTWPVYTGARIPRWKLGAGLLMYDALALFRNVARHKRLSRDGVLACEPMLRQDGLLGGARYYDAATNDARLTLANAIAAAESGATVVNHAAVTTLLIQSGRVVGARVRDALTGQSAEVHARVVVNATGPWSDQTRRLDEAQSSDTAPRSAAVRGSKGAHIAVPRERLGNRDALTLSAPLDGRVMFALPAGPHAIVGTTDSYAATTPDEVRATNDDVNYLLDSVNAFFPAARLAASDIVSAWAGIRPLLPTASDSPGSASREHAITTSRHGLVSITGGKLTTYRVMAAGVVDVVVAAVGRRAGPEQTRSLALPGGDFASLGELIAAATKTTNDPALAQHLVGAHGSRWPRVWEEMTKGDGRLSVHDGLPYTLGELRYSARHEMAYTIGDLLIRRTGLAFETRDHGAAAAVRIAGALAATFGWDHNARQRAIDDYVSEAERIFSVDA